MSDELKACPHCQSPYGYSMGETLYACPECSHEWDPTEVEVAEESKAKVLDSNGNELVDGDSVIVIKNLPIKRCLQSYKSWHQGEKNKTR